MQAAAAPLRTPRALAAAGVSGIAGTWAHLLSGGETPAPVAAIVLGLVLLGTARALSGRRLDSATLAAIVLLGQGLAHVVLHVGSAAGTGRTPFWGDSAASMALGHLLVAGLALAVARRTEQALLQLAAERLHRLPRLLTPVVPLSPASPLLPAPALAPRPAGHRRVDGARAPPASTRVPALV
ncbi:hypothetical protein GCM10027425_07590 [Alteromonas gracilis]